MPDSEFDLTRELLVPVTDLGTRRHPSGFQRNGITSSTTQPGMTPMNHKDQNNLITCLPWLTRSSLIGLPHSTTGKPSQLPRKSKVTDHKGESLIYMHIEVYPSPPQGNFSLQQKHYRKVKPIKFQSCRG